MSILIFEGWSHDTPASRNDSWGSGSYGNGVGSFYGRRGLQIIAGSTERIPLGYPEVVVGAVVVLTSVSNRVLWRLNSNGGLGSTSVRLLLLDDGRLQLDNGASVVFGTSVQQLGANHNDFLELHAVCGTGVAGSLELRVNGQPWIAVQAINSDRYVGGSYADWWLEGNNTTYLLEPLYALAVDSVAPSSFLSTAAESPRVWGLSPVATVAADPGWTPSTGTSQHAVLASLPNTTDYLSSAGAAVSEFALADLIADPGDFLHGVRVCLSARRDGSEGLKVRVGVRAAGATAWGEWWSPPIGADASAARLHTWTWLTDPAAAPWSKAAVDSATVLLECGTV